MEKVKRDGKVAILYSPGFGAGWSTWNRDHEKILLFSPILVDAIEKKVKITEAFVRDNLGIEIYDGGAEYLEIEWVPEGEQFEINEYDGSESVNIIGQNQYLIA